MYEVNVDQLATGGTISYRRAICLHISWTATRRHIVQKSAYTKVTLYFNELKYVDKHSPDFYHQVSCPKDTIISLSLVIQHKSAYTRILRYTIFIDCLNKLST